MVSNLDETPQANRLHIAFFGKTNAGKSSVINAMTGQDIALVSDVAGTTTDPVYKAMELLPIGPVVPHVNLRHFQTVVIACVANCYRHLNHIFTSVIFFGGSGRKIFKVCIAQSVAECPQCFRRREHIIFTGFILTAR